MEASFQIGGRAEELGLDQKRVENVLRSAFDLEKRREYRSEELEETTKVQKEMAPEQPVSFGQYLLPGGLFQASKKSSRYINIESAIIPWPSDEWRFDFAELLHKAYEPEEIVGIKKRVDSPTQLQKVGDLLKVRENIPQLMRTLDGGGSLIYLNPASGERETDVMSFRHVLLRVKNLELGKQLAFFKMFNLPCSALVNCGGKFIQGWVKVEAENKEDYMERVTTLQKTLQDIGFEVDTQEGDPLAKAGIPGVLVEGKQQYLIEFEEGASSWEEWESWSEAYLDGDPLVEPSSGYDEPPLKSAEIVEDLFRQGQKVLLSGPSLCGKSMTSLDLALSICQGVPWLENETEETEVLYVNLEQDSTTLVNRLYEVAEEREIEAVGSNLDFLHLMGTDKTATELCEFLVKRVNAMRKWENKKFSTLIVDGIEKLPGFYSQEGLANQSLAGALDKLVLQTSAAVVVVCTDEPNLNRKLAADVTLRLNTLEESGQEGWLQLSVSGRYLKKDMDRKLVWNYPLLKNV